MTDIDLGKPFFRIDRKFSLFIDSGFGSKGHNRTRHSRYGRAPLYEGGILLPQSVFRKTGFNYQHINILNAHF